MYNSQYLQSHHLQYLQWVVCYEICKFWRSVLFSYNFYMLCPSLGTRLDVARHVGQLLMVKKPFVIDQGLVECF